MNAWQFMADHPILTVILALIAGWTLVASCGAIAAGISVGRK